MIPSFFLWLAQVYRPRLWILYIGAFYIGATTGSGGAIPSSLLTKEVFLLALWILLGRPLFSHALNDAFDIETDARNPRKKSLERGAHPSEKKLLLFVSFVALAPFFFLLPLFSSVTNIYLILSVAVILAYNIPPIRLKARAVWDTVAGGITVPSLGAAGYAIQTGTHPDLFLFLAAIASAMAIHTYASLLDIEYDRQAGVRTTAVAIGSVQRGLVLCLVLSCIPIGILFAYSLSPIGFLAALFPAFFLIEFFKKGTYDRAAWYRSFVYLLYASGFLLSILAY